MPQDVHSARDIREAIGVLGDPQELERTVEDLLTEGFNHSDISLLASEETAREKLGHGYPDTRAAEDDPKAPRIEFVEPESRVEARGALAGILGYVGAVTAGGIAFATGGAAGVIIAAGLVGGGALGSLGAVLGRILDQRLASTLENQVRHGGIVLWVRVADQGQEETALRVLSRHGARDVHVHTVPAA